MSNLASFTSRDLSLAPALLACGHRAPRRAACSGRRTRPLARPCARSISACRWRRPTWCIRRPMSRRTLGFFAKRCIDANIVQFEGGQSHGLQRGGRARIGHRRGQRRRHRPRHEGAAVLGSRAAHAAGLHGRSRTSRTRPISKANGCPPPAAASAASTGAWAARCSRSAGLTVDDAHFLAVATAGRLPGLIANQIDAVALHPEDVFLAKKQKPTLQSWCSSPT